MNYPTLINVMLLVICINGDGDYYKLLGVSKSATTKELRRAFKKLAIEKHPDKNRVIMLKYYVIFW